MTPNFACASKGRIFSGPFFFSASSVGAIRRSRGYLERPESCPISALMKLDVVVSRRVVVAAESESGDHGRERHSDSSSSPKIFFEACKSEICLERRSQNALQRSSWRRAAGRANKVDEMRIERRTCSRFASRFAGESRGGNAVARCAETPLDRPSKARQASRWADRCEPGLRCIFLFSLYFSHSLGNCPALPERVIACVGKTSPAHPQW